MNAGLKWKLITGFVLVFIAGGLTGGFLAAGITRHFFSVEAHRGLAAEHMRERLRRQLDLTPEQMTKISPILDQAAKELEEIRKDTTRQVHDVFAQARRDISSDLTDEQREKLKRIRRHHERWHHDRHGQDLSPESTPP